MPKFVKGQSGNPAGMAKGRAHKATEAVRKLINDNSAAILTKVIEQAKSGDSQAQATFIKLMPRHRFVATPTELSAAKDSDEAKLQINKLVSMCAAGFLDLDSLRCLTDALRISIDGRIHELENIVDRFTAEQEGG